MKTRKVLLGLLLVLITNLTLAQIKFTDKEKQAFEKYYDWVEYTLTPDKKTGKLKNKISSILYVGLGIAFNVDTDLDFLTTKKYNLKSLSNSYKLKKNIILIICIFAFKQGEIELQGYFVPYTYYKYSEETQLAIGVTLGNYVINNYRNSHQQHDLEEESEQKETEIKVYTPYWQTS